MIASFWQQASNDGADKNLDLYGVSETASIVINTAAESATQTSKIRITRGTATKSAAQLTKENAKLWGKAAVKLNVLGGTVGTVTSTYGAYQDFSQGNTGWGIFNTCVCAVIPSCVYCL